MINQKDTVFVKTTQEEVLVLAVDNKEPVFPGLSGIQVIVSRPKIGQNGVEHVTESFLLEQLETIEERYKREYDMRQRVKTISESLETKEVTQEATVIN